MRPAHAIMIAFLKNINAGMPKDVALQHAKRSYRAQYFKKDMAAPGFWAPLTLIGDNNPVPLDSNIGWIVLLTLVLVSSGIYVCKKYPFKLKMF